jgi:hypothetical protein
LGELEGANHRSGDQGEILLLKQENLANDKP